MQPLSLCAWGLRVCTQAEKCRAPQPRTEYHIFFAKFVETQDVVVLFWKFPKILQKNGTPHQKVSHFIITEIV